MKLVVALDFDNRAAVYALVDQLDPTQCALKVGSELFTYFGADLVRDLVARQFKVFLDLKFHDIPTTVARSCMACADLGVWMLTLHASGGLAMMSAARQALRDRGEASPLVMAVTVLTSLSDVNLREVGVYNSLDQHVRLLAQSAKQAELDGVICSAHEVAMIKALCGSSFLAATPGIRLVESPLHDQVRTLTPQQAIAAGSDYLIIGRPITQARDPVRVVRTILDSLCTAS